jgi:NTE family protein
MNKTGIVLSGGGARGAAHLGFIKLLEELNIPIDMVSGVSAGAVIGALYTSGLGAEQILTILKGQSYISLKGLSFGSSGIFSMATLRDILKKHIPHNDFDRLRIPLFITATDMVNCKAICFSEGAVIDAVIASASVPVVYEPVNFGGYTLADGGILDNLPAHPLADLCDIIIGNHVNRISTDIDMANISKFAIIDRSFHMAVAQKVYESAKLCNLVVEPDLSAFGMFQMKDADKIFEIGYKAAKALSHNILSLYE